MSEQDVDQLTKRRRRVSELVAAYVASNRVPSSVLPALIATVADALDALAVPRAPSVSEPVAKPTEDEISKSIGRDKLISFVDGKGYKTLGRHLRFHGLTPQSYRARYGLPIDYPMVAPSYSEKRSEISREISLRQPPSARKRTLQ